MSNVDFNPSSVESCAEYRMQMLKIKHKDGTFLETHDKKCEFCRLWYTHNQDSLAFSRPRGFDLWHGSERELNRKEKLDEELNEILREEMRK
jgi:hypothetical protein